jgi:hypothetical protein
MNSNPAGSAQVTLPAHWRRSMLPHATKPYRHGRRRMQGAAPKIHAFTP